MNDKNEINTANDNRSDEIGPKMMIFRDQRKNPSFFRIVTFKEFGAYEIAAQALIGEEEEEEKFEMIN